MRRHGLRLLLAALVIAIVALLLLFAGEGDEPLPPSRDRTDTGGERRPGERERDERRDGDGAAPLGDGTVPGAGRRLVVGMGDQKLDLFEDRRFSRLGIRHVRLVMPWNAPLGRAAQEDAWLRAARAAGLEPLVAFNHAAGARCPASPCRAPSPREFERAAAAFRERWPWVRAVSTWNEPNHATQPVAQRPELVARYWLILRQLCGNCRVLAADVVADRTAARWVPAFRRAAGTEPRLWGVHNYSDTNRFRSDGTREFLRLTRGEVWITETGGVVKFTTADGRTPLPYDERRAARAIRQMFRVARSDRRITRLYLYHWSSTADPGRFDAGLIGTDGEARPAYAVVRDELSR